MASPLRDLFNEFPGLPYRLLVEASEYSDLRNALRRKGSFVLVYVTEGEYTALCLDDDTPMPRLAKTIIREPVEYLVRDGKVLQYKLESTVTIMEDGV